MAPVTTPHPPPGPISIGSLPLASDFGELHGRDGFRNLAQTLFARPDAPFVRDADSALVVLRNRHLRALAVHPAAGNTPPAVLARGAFDRLQDPARSPAGGGAEIVRTVTSQIFFMNGPLHDAARRILTTQLTPRAAAEASRLADEAIAALLPALTSGEPADFHSVFSERLASAFWGAMIGMSADEIAEMPEHVRAMNSIFFARPSEAEISNHDLATERYARTVRDAAMRSLAGGENELVAAMARQLDEIDQVHDPERNGVAPPDIGRFLAGNLLDAFHTAALGVSNAVAVALDQPGLLALLRREPERIAAAAAEALRLEPPVLFLNRYALEDFEFEGVHIPQGARIVMGWAAGNFDPEAFDDPFRFDLSRPQRGATTFGSGPQICPGRIMAAMLVQRTLKALADSELTLDGRPSWHERSSMAQPRAMMTRAL